MERLSSGGDSLDRERICVQPGVLRRLGILRRRPKGILRDFSPREGLFREETMSFGISYSGLLLPAFLKPTRPNNPVTSSNTLEGSGTDAKFA